MDRWNFDKGFEGLPPRQREVLDRFLAGKTDAEIAEELHIEKTTVRKHIENISRAFVVKGRHQREELKKLFAKYKPELLPTPLTPTPTQDEPEEDVAPPEITAMTGVMPWNSPVYVEREADRKCREVLQTARNRQASMPFVRIKGARGLGKSSFLVRQRHWLRTEQKQVVGFVDLGGEKFDPDAFADQKKLFYQFTYAVAQTFSDAFPKLSPPDLKQFWRDDVAAASNCTDYLDRHIFAKIKEPKTLMIDGIDKVLGRKETQTPFLNLLRSWNETKMKDVGQEVIVWPSLVIASSTEPYVDYEIPDSPLQNVGIQIALEKFSFEQIVELAKRYNVELSFKQAEALMDLLGGHPALLNSALYPLSQNHLTFDELMDRAIEITGPFAYFLQKNLKYLQLHEDERECFKEILLNRKCDRHFAKYQLKLLGLISGYPAQVQVSCELYRQFFKKDWKLDDEQ